MIFSCRNSETFFLHPNSFRKLVAYVLNFEKTIKEINALSFERQTGKELLSVQDKFQ